MTPAAAPTPDQGDPARVGPPPGAHPLLEVRHLVRRFGDFVAVDDVSLSVGPGEVVGLLGANGAGKTTLLRVGLGLLAPTSGQARLLGALPGREVRRRVGYVPQGLGLYADMSIRENLEFVASVYGRPRPAVPESMADRADELVGRISLGTQRELAFACALLHDPELVVLDEPTSGVSALTATGLWNTIHERAEAGIGVLVTTHNMQEAQQCDRLLLMAGGRLVAEGSEAEIVGGTTAVRVHVGDWARAFEVLASAGLPVSLDGTDVRVADVSADRVAAALAQAGLAGELESVPATIEERMSVLAAWSAAGAH
jgi:ABC-2 type transport system ATP-binding protein/ribosome-dependent ATPase